LLSEWQVTRHTRIRRGGSAITRTFHLILFFTDSVQIYVFMFSSPVPFSGIFGFQNTDPLKIAQCVRRRIHNFFVYLIRSYIINQFDMTNILRQICLKTYVRVCVFVRSQWWYKRAIYILVKFRQFILFHGSRKSNGDLCLQRYYYLHIMCFREWHKINYFNGTEDKNLCWNCWTNLYLHIHMLVMKIVIAFVLLKMSIMWRWRQKNSHRSATYLSWEGVEIYNFFSKIILTT
jgi:hypothetical protein